MDQAPRGPIVREKSGTLDVEDGYKTKIKRFREGTRQQSIRELRSNKEWAMLAQYIRALEGSMWPRNRPKFRSPFVDNHLARARKETLAQYTDIRPTIQVKSEPFQQQADILTKLTVNQWVKHNMEITLTECLDHALLSVGYWKINGATGRVSAIACGMDTVMPINCNGNIQEASAIRYHTFKPISYFRQKWGKDLAERLLRSDKSANGGQAASNYGSTIGMNDYSWSRLSPSMRYIMRDRVPDETANPDNRDTFPVAELEEIWWEDYNVNELSRPVIIKDPYSPLATHNYWYEVKPGERLYPRKRLIVGAGDETPYDGPSPFWTPKYPFAMLALDPVVWAPGGLSKYRTLLPLNMGMNEISAGVFDTVKKAINQAYVAKRGSVSPADWDRFYPEIPGQKMLMNNTAQVGDVRALDPPILPPYVLEVVRGILQSFDRHAGSIDVGSFSRKNQVPGGDTMEQIRDMQTAPVRLEGKYIEKFLKEAGEIAISHEIQYFPKKYRFAIMGNDGVTWEDYTFDPTNMVPASHAKESFWKEFEVTMSPGSLHGANKERDQVKALTLYKAGALSLETLLRKADVGDIQAEIQRIIKEREAGLIPGGVDPGAGDAGSGRTPRLLRSQRTGAA